MRALLAVSLALGVAGCAPAGPMSEPVTVSPSPRVAPGPRRILFIGNSFTFGALSPVMRYRSDSVRDLNGDGIGGVPALFKTFADQAGLAYDVALETAPGRPLQWHLDTKREVIGEAWDDVVMQGYSTLDPERPGDPARHGEAARALAALFDRANPAVRVALTATWTRADQTFQPEGHWYGQPVTRMAQDLQAATTAIVAGDRSIDIAVPAGEAWNCAFERKIADPDPYDGTSIGQIDLWSYDHYHASAAGYYLEALTVFGAVTQTDPRSLGRDERAAGDLGLSPELAMALQGCAAQALGRN